MLESGIYVRDFGTRLEEIQLPGTGQYNEMLLNGMCYFGKTST
jgi:hypothetical protein